MRTYLEQRLGIVWVTRPLHLNTLCFIWVTPGPSWQLMSCSWQMPWRARDRLVTSRMMMRPDSGSSPGRQLPWTLARLRCIMGQKASPTWVMIPINQLPRRPLPQKQTLCEQVFSRKFLIETNENLFIVFSAERMLIITLSLTAAINNAINKVSQLLLVLLIFLKLTVCEIIWEFLS